MGFAADRSGPDLPLPFHASPPAAPEAGPGSDGHIALAMVERITRLGPKSGAEALRALRSAFPDSPLALRVTALGLLMRRQQPRHTL
jgi:hypothetical protein